MKYPIKKWLSSESQEAKRKSHKWSSLKPPYPKSKDELHDNQWWRLKIIDLLNQLRPDAVSGKVMDVGAGFGFASAYLTSYKSVKKVYAIDYSKEACKRIIKTASNFEKAIPSKLQAIHGSFDDIKDNNFNLIIAFGAIHNSPDLSLTFRSLFNKLAPNGILLVSDMCLSYNATIKDEEWATNRIIPNSKKIYGKKLRFLDTNDYFRSIYDYFFFSKKAGFRVYPIVWSTDNKNELKNLEKDLNGPYPKTFFPFFARGHFDRLMLICEKDSKINKDCLPKISYYSSISYNFIKHNYFIRIVKIFNKFGLTKGLKIILIKLKKKLKV